MPPVASASVAVRGFNVKPAFKWQETAVSPGMDGFYCSN